MLKNENFLNAASFISENQAEYSILSDLYLECQNMFFMLEISKLRMIKFEYDKILKYIKENYKSFDLRNFQFKSDGTLCTNIIKNISGNSLKDEDFFNIAMEISRKNNSYILIRTNGILVLLKNGIFDSNFNNIFTDKQALIDINNKKRNINELQLVFENYHSERKYKGCDFIENHKVKDSISEQQLRNSLISFLEKTTNLHIVPELCTSKQEDEESVDIGVINSNNEVAIIEVKYFVKQGYFSNPDKKAYSKSRFRDGYKQLNRYCIHLNKENYKLHSAFLYMFYAHSDSLEEINNVSQEYYHNFINDDSSSCSEEFKCHYKDTVCDNMMDIKLVV